MRLTLFFRNWTSLISIVLSFIIIAILLIAHFILTPELETQSNNREDTINIVQEPLTKEKDYLDMACSELRTEFNSETRVDLANILLDIMELRDCRIRLPCMSDAKFSYTLEQFEKGLITAERFTEINEEYANCE
ncbi:MAG: hypothetical protein ABIB47_04425 [Candidatus Woesearchaeota archaeon]